MRRVGILASALLVVTGVLVVRGQAESQRPNLVVFMTDDQTLESMRFMPETVRLIGGKGVTFSESYVSYPLCCPSRATFLTGQYAHNHGVRWNLPGYASFKEATLATTLKQNGYRTIHVGKYLNGYGLEDETDVPKGWTSWNGLVDPYTYQMWGYKLNQNGHVSKWGSAYTKDPALYQTDVLAKVARNEIRKSAGKSFFLNLAFLAPHKESNLGPLGAGVDPRPAPRHAKSLSGLTYPRTPAFDEADTSDKLDRLAERKRLTREVLTTIEGSYKARMRSLLAVDDAIASVIGELKTAGVLDNTLIMFTSDNGYFLGEHRISYGKYLPYSSGARVPLLVRGPGVAVGKVSAQPVSNVDLAPTLLAAARIDPTSLDGEPLQQYLADPLLSHQRGIFFETYSIEDSIPELKAKLDLEDPEVSEPYRGLRVGRWAYFRYWSGHAELYDLWNDPFELESLADDVRFQPFIQELDAVMVQMGTCSAQLCRALAGFAATLAPAEALTG